MKWNCLPPLVWICALVLPAGHYALHGAAIADASLIGQVRHSPEQPHEKDVVIITAKINPGEGLKSVTLQYQTIDPGKYIALNDSEYKTRWPSLPMTDTGQNGDEVAGDGIYAVRMPAELQKHRRLVRYRVVALNAQGRTITMPPPDDTSPNFGYFVYDGLPAWSAAIDSNSRDPKRRAVVQYGTKMMQQVQVYHLISKSKAVENATWLEQPRGKEYPYTGTLVANGKVYDHIRYRARGGEWRYAMGKNMWKFDFNAGHNFEAVDDYGQKYQTKWSKLNLRACIQQGDYGHRGEQGMFEAVGFRLFNLAGVESPATHWIQLRIISEEEENPRDQYHGDFWGLYLAIENEDGHFLKEHKLPDGNLYKMMFGQGELNNHGENAVTDGSDLQRFLTGLRRPQSEAWWRTNVDLPRYYSYRSIIEAIHHYDVGMGKNYDSYHNPKTGQWVAIPWDIDLTWADNMFGNGNEPFHRPVLSQPVFLVEYQNRLREIRDLLFNADQTFQLIDECAAIIADPAGASSIVDADRAKWDYHPVMASRHALPEKAGQGLFYQASRNGSFSGMVQLMKDYVKSRSAYIDNRLSNDPAFPATPTVTYDGPSGFPIDRLRFRASDFAGRGQFAAMKWRIGEVTLPSRRTNKPAQPNKYEITPVWETGELTTFKNEVTIASDALTVGHTYRARVRMKDNSGRWSHWSEALQFTTGPVAK